jgi:hypothetical protein
VNAEALLLLQDPGPKTQRANQGSGFLSIENDDPSARRLARILDHVRLDVSRLVSWNVYPWYINRKPTGREQDEGVEPCRRIIDAMPNLRAVVLMGDVSCDFWSKRFARRYPDRAARVRIFSTLLCSGRGITGGGKHSAEVGERSVRSTYEDVSQFLSNHHGAGGGHDSK